MRKSEYVILLDVNIGFCVTLHHMFSGTVIVHRNLGVVLGGNVDQNIDINDVLGIHRQLRFLGYFSIWSTRSEHFFEYSRISISWLRVIGITTELLGKIQLWNKQHNKRVWGVGLLYRFPPLYHIHEIMWEGSRTSLTVGI